MGGNSMTSYVIVVNWNSSEDTIQCVESLQSSNAAGLRILLIDNASFDDSLVRFKERLSGIDLIESPENLGFSGGCNLGIRRALADEADFVWLLNNDAIPEARALDAMLEVMRGDAEVGAVGSAIYYPGEDKRLQAWGGGWISFLTGRTRHCKSREEAEKLDYLTGASLLIRRQVLEDIGLLDEDAFFMYWEDCDFSLRMRKAGWKLAVAEDSIVYHKEHGSTGSNNPLLAFYYNESAVRFFRRHARFPLWPIMIGAAGRFVKRLLRADLPGAMAVLKGTLRGFRPRHGGALNQ